MTLTVARLRTPSPPPSPPAVEVSRTVTIRGLKRTLSSDILKLYFSSVKKSQGGPVEDVVVNQEAGNAIITFQHHEGMICRILCIVLRKLSSSAPTGDKYQDVCESQTVLSGCFETKVYATFLLHITFIRCKSPALEHTSILCTQMLQE